MSTYVDESIAFKFMVYHGVIQIKIIGGLE